MKRLFVITERRSGAARVPPGHFSMHGSVGKIKNHGTSRDEPRGAMWIQENAERCSRTGSSRILPVGEQWALATEWSSTESLTHHHCQDYHQMASPTGLSSQKGAYVNGHERNDVVAHRKKFLVRWRPSVTHTCHHHLQVTRQLQHHLLSQNFSSNWC